VLRRSSAGARTTQWWGGAWRGAIEASREWRRPGEVARPGTAGSLGRWWPRAQTPRGGTARARHAARERARRRSGQHRDRVLAFEIEKLHFLNTSAQLFEYESCRSHYPLQLSQRPYGVFSIDFAQQVCELCMPLNCSEQEVLTFGQVFHIFPLKI
jgi:hypothetical protein